jgi:YVTN family beta-propeller protein
LLAAACGGGGGGDSGVPPADPAGTVTSDLRVQGQGPNAINFTTGAIATGTLNADVSLDSAGNLVAGSGATIADAGAVPGVGSLTTVPDAGFVASASAIPGHGYVVRVASASYVRFFVVADIIGATTGGVIGKTIRWAFLKKIATYAISPANPTIAKGLKQQFTLGGTYDDGSPATSIPVAHWSGTSITPGGLATASVPGTFTIGAAVVFNAQPVATTTFTVGPPSVQSIALLPSNPTIPNGTHERFVVSGTFSDGTIAEVSDQATFTSSAESIAAVSGSTATAAAIGSTIITATVGSVSATSTLTVSGPRFPSPTTNRGYVNGGINVFAFDLSSLTLVATIPLGPGTTPTEGLAVDAAAHRVYAGYTSGIAVIDTDANSLVTTIPSLGGGGFALHAAANRLYAVGPSQFVSIDTATGTVVSRLSLSSQFLAVDGVAVDPGANKAFVTESGANAVVAIDLASNSIAATIPLGNSIAGAARTPTWIALDAAAHRAYVSNMGDGSVSIIDTNANTVVGNISVTAPTATRIGIEVDPAHSRLYVAKGDSGTIAVIDTTSDTVVGTTNLSPAGKVQSGFVAVDPAGTIYAPYSGSVSVVDGTSDQQTGTVALNLNIELNAIALAP